MIKPSPRSGSRFVVLAGFCAGALLWSSPSPVFAARAEPEPGLHEADRHFERGVALYLEADYHGALVEFTRAYTLAPNGVVLFNVGETQFQLRDYAAALATFEQYLVEAPSSDGHRALAERNIKELRTRVGWLRVVTVPPGAAVTIGDRLVGQTPIEKPIVVGIGQVMVRAALPGRPPIVRTVEIAAEDDVLVTMEIPAPSMTTDDATTPGTDLVARPAPPRVENKSALRVLGWVATGALAGGAVTFGLLARSESKDLQNARRDWYPATPDAINHLANRTKTLSMVADSFTAAALVVGGITLYSTISAHAGTHAARVAVGPGWLRLDARF